MAEQEGQTKESNKQLAMEQKVLLQDLFRAKNRPDPFSPQNNEIYVIAKEVIDKWRSFVRYVSFKILYKTDSTVRTESWTGERCPTVALCCRP